MSYQFNNTATKLIGKVQNKLDQARKQFCRQKIIFLHIPKCGGTSITNAIASSVGASTKGYINPIHTREIAQEILGDQAEGSRLLLQLRQAILLDNYFKNESYIFGHFPIVRKVLDEPKNYLLVTVLREPVERFMSQFRYYLATRYTNQLEHNQILSLEEIEKIWQNYIHSNLAIFHANTLSAYLNDDSNLEIGIEASSNRAIDNLNHFHIVGFLDQLGIFTNQFYQRSGSQLTIPSENKTQNKVSRKQNELFKDFLDKEKYSTAKKMCYYDIKIYEYALQFQTMN